jgi:hypothetical protein
LHHFNVAFALPLSLSQGDKETSPWNKTRKPLQMLLVVRLRQLARVIAFKQYSIQMRGCSDFNHQLISISSCLGLSLLKV